MIDLIEFNIRLTINKKKQENKVRNRVKVIPDIFLVSKHPKTVLYTQLGIYVLNVA